MTTGRGQIKNKAIKNSINTVDKGLIYKVKTNFTLLMVAEFGGWVQLSF